MGAILSRLFKKWLNPFYWIAWAPLFVPAHRRLQTLSCFLMLLPIPVLLLLNAIFLRNPKTRPYMLGFWVWQMYLDNAPTKGNTPVSRWFRNLACWRYGTQYFPVRVVKTAELPPEEGPYMIGCFPHGILPFSIMCNWLTNGSNMDETFPGLKYRTAILNLCTQIPLVAQMAKIAGAIRADRTSLENTLKSGQTVVIVPGGAEESLLSRPGELALIAADRKGFVKVAVDQGAHLVPALSIGENQLFKQVRLAPGGILDILMHAFKKMTSFVLPPISGRGFFNYSFGLLPHRREIITVIGEPIQVERIARSDPGFESMVDYYHKEFVLQLERMYALYRKDKEWGLTLSLEEKKEEEDRESLVRGESESKMGNLRKILSKL